jgi:nitroreductase
MTPPEAVADGNGFFEVTGRQRACRRFRNDPVPDADIERILHAATLAPSSENAQPWVFVVAKRAEVRAELGRIMREIWETGSSTRATMDPTMLADVHAGLTGNIAAAPALIVAGADTRMVPRRWMSSSIYPAVQNMLLAAYAVGAASALTTIATLRADEVRAAVAFPEHIDPIAIVPIGYPASRLGPPARRPVRACTYADQFDAPWIPVSDP